MRARGFALGWLVAASLAGVAATDIEPQATAAGAPATTCLASTAPSDLDALFAAEPGGVLGADYQRTTLLENGDVFWTFQDAAVRRTNGTIALVHNIAMLQSGSCFTTLIGGTAADPQSLMFNEATEPFERWYWPLDATMGADGVLYVFVAEMVERGDTYLSVVEPTATRVAGIDLDTHEVVSLGNPGDATPSLYGWSITGDDQWTYLYAQCHRQFGYDVVFDLFAAHDLACSDRVTVARIARGDVFGSPTYWTGSGWSRNPARAVPVIETDDRAINPTDVIHLDGHWLAVTKVGDWWGDEVIVESSVRAVGPFETIEVFEPTTKCNELDCNTYYASWITPADGQLAIGLSHNRWDGVFSDVYRPTFRAADIPDARPPVAGRCALGYCD